jgi:NhaA family Na+:H+ antiporter
VEALVMNNSKGALNFLRHEAAGSGLLLFAAVLALILANSPLSVFYSAFLDTQVTIRVGSLLLDKPLLLWINDGLMAIFFFLVGLEIKRELLLGELSTLKQASLPLVAAIGGIIVPAVIYFAINSSDPPALAGWAIPTATDIAFAVGVLSLLSTRVPPALKVFLLALAIIDDLGAIIIIAIFYTPDLSALALAAASAGLIVLTLLNRRGVYSVAPYVIAGIFVWVCVLKSGVHATLAGVATAFAVPLGSSDGEKRPASLAEALEESLHPWVIFGVLPLFAFANAGVSLSGVTLEQLTSGVPLGIALGLALGKPLGVLSASFLAIKAGFADKPAGTDWGHLLGAGILAGIGFTMSLFIGILAFPAASNSAEIRLGVLCGSIISAIVGYLWLVYYCRSDYSPA